MSTNSAELDPNLVGCPSGQCQSKIGGRIGPKCAKAYGRNWPNLDRFRPDLGRIRMCTTRGWVLKPSRCAPSMKKRAQNTSTYISRWRYLGKPPSNASQGLHVPPPNWIEECIIRHSGGGDSLLDCCKSRRSGHRRRLGNPPLKNEVAKPCREPEQMQTVACCARDGLPRRLSDILAQARRTVARMLARRALYRKHVDT